MAHFPGGRVAIERTGQPERGPRVDLNAGYGKSKMV
jgi:hypothetical protein